MGESSWMVVIPVKGLAGAKSRLRGALPGVPHEDLALALAIDTVAAALQCAIVGEVVVVTDDPAVRGATLALGATVIPDPPGGGLNPAFRKGAALAGGRPVAALTGDLPALRAGELADALQALREVTARTGAAGRDGAARRDCADGTLVEAGRDGAVGRLVAVRGFVTDAAGTGTTLLAAAASVPLRPRFGPGSALAHETSGAVALSGPWHTLRQDVDTPADLRVAAALGLGAHTAALLVPR